MLKAGAVRNVVLWFVKNPGTSKVPRPGEHCRRVMEDWRVMVEGEERGCYGILGQQSS